MTIVESTVRMSVSLHVENIQLVVAKGKVESVIQVPHVTGDLWIFQKQTAEAL